jgi:23S rRNA (cytosine1962-C5)-methyltransferase
MRRGHPWLFREAFPRPLAETTGTPVTVAVEGAPPQLGLWDSVSPIAVRLWGPVRPFDEALLEERFRQAFRLRELFIGESTTAYRLVNGEGDRMPGVVLDRYADVAVLRLDGAAIGSHRKLLARVLERLLPPLGVRTLLSRVAEKDRSEEAVDRALLWGPEAPTRIAVAEHGMPFYVDLASGQKTGAFLDQRENRKRIGDMTALLAAKLGRAPKVLNLFSYAGGFSLAAARAGATTTSVDIAAAAHATAQASFKLAGLDPSAHSFRTADVFVFLEGAVARGDRFDIVICDPPSFAPSEKTKERGLGAYRKLHRAAVSVLAENGSVRPSGARGTDEPTFNGIFCAASCSSHVSLDEFHETLDDDTLGRSDLRVFAAYGPPEDHPTLASFPEGRYLKFVAMR